MYTVSDIIMDVNRHCMVNNMVENAFSYQIIFFVNENGAGRKYYIDTSYSGLRSALENIVRENLSLENSISISGVTVQKNGRCVCLLSRVYSFNLCDYFQQITGRGRNGNKKRYASYGRYALNAN